MTNRDDITRRFADDAAQHALKIVHDDGLYRHLRFRRQEWRPPLAEPQPSGLYWFDLITVPGTLIFQGDGDSYVFSRVEDMFEFFRSPVGEINPNYWAEKLTTAHGRDGAKRYDPDRFVQVVREEVEFATEDGALPGLAAAVDREIFAPGDYHFNAADAQRALEQFAHYENPTDRNNPEKGPDFTFEEWWELDLRDYDWWFLWACHAIVWGIAYYDAVKTGQPAPALPTAPRGMVTVNLPEPS